MSRRSEPQARTARKTRTESKTPADSNADSVEAVETASDSSGGQDARQRICLAAFQLFGTRGYSCTSIQDIADAATVKKSITGAGAAEKAQVAFMVRRILAVPEDLKIAEDAADALAVALCQGIS